MKPAAFDYARPRSLSEALELLARPNADARVIAGGQSLVAMMNLRVASPGLLVDIARLPDLGSITEEDSTVFYGACVTHAMIEDRVGPDPSNGLMPKVAETLAYRAVRNRGTIGGSLAHADPAGDWPSALTLLGATAVIAGPNARREVPAELFVTGIFTTVLEADELLVAIRIPKRSARARYGYWKFCRKAGEFAQAIGAALTDPERDESRAVIGALRGPPFLLRNAELTDDALATAGDDAYSRQLHVVALKRALAQVLQ
jgi:carbon-monoxide dehydrogenase medium subunit